MLEKRIRAINDAGPKDGPVVYWMSRDQRVADNWGLIYAQTEAISLKKPLLVVFNFVEDYLVAQSQHYAFMAKGLIEVYKELATLNIPFHMVQGKPEKSLPDYLKRQQAGMLITDFHVLKENRSWKDQVASRIHIAFHEVDTHNIVPVWEASPKQEYGAYTIRPKINRLLPDYLVDFPALSKHPYENPDLDGRDADTAGQSLELLTGRITGLTLPAGSKSAVKQLQKFVDERLSMYHLRNDPTVQATSGLSPYLHYGQISAQRIALEVRKVKDDNKDEFLEELIVRKELADNFCFYNRAYDAVAGFPRWAKETLQNHEMDIREYVYDEDDLEAGITHDALWNAAQREMVAYGTMPGYLRMYWAKKILEWSESADQAMEIAVRFNNTYFMDGRDPNGYTGIAWSIGGVHDRAWGEREIFGKVRYMSQAGAARKFNVRKYIQSMAERTGEPVPGKPGG